MTECPNCGESLRTAKERAAGECAWCLGDVTPRDGTHAVIVTHSAVFGRSEKEVREYHVGPVGPYAQYAKSLTITYKQPRKRRSESVRFYGDEQWDGAIRHEGRYATIEVYGVTIYDTRWDIPIDMDGWDRINDRFKHGVRPGSIGSVA